jgi:hypothetical protein
LDIGGDYKSVSTSVFLKDFSIVFLKSAGIGLIAAIVWSYIFDKIRNLPNTIFTSLAFIFILFGVSHYIHTSAPITVLFFSMIISIPSENKIRRFSEKFNIPLIEFSESEKLFYEEILFIIKTFFFVFLGVKMSYFDGLEIALVLVFYLKALALTAVLFFIRFLCIKLTKPKIDKNKLIVLLSMVPKGLAAAVLISFYVSNVQMSSDISQELIYTTYGVILLSIFASSILVFIAEKRIKNQVAQAEEALKEKSDESETSKEADINKANENF